MRESHAKGVTPSSTRWLLLIHQIPPKPDYLRVKIGRRLQRVGAVAVKNSVYVLPATPQTLEDFQWIRAEIVDGGGEAVICRAAFVDGLTDGGLQQLFRDARAGEYEEIAVSAHELLEQLTADGAESESDTARVADALGRLKKRIAAVVAIDFFGGPERRRVEDA